MGREDVDESLRWRVERLQDHAQHLGQIQVNADTIYHHRSSVITLTQGLALVAFQAAANGQLGGSDYPRFVVTGFGILLSALWFAFEQRNQIYFTGRGVAVELAERRLFDEARKAGLDIQSFWTSVPGWVRNNARWYQRASGPRIQRGIIPILFILLWIGILVATVAVR